MWKKVLLCLTLALLVMTGTVLAAEPAATVTRTDSSLPRVAVLIANNAKTTYDDRLTRHEKEFFQTCFPSTSYTWVDGDPYLKKLADMGLTDLSTVERADFLDAFEGSDVDYIVYLEIQPFTRKERKSWFTHSVDMTTQLPFKIIDVKRNKYLYNGKFTEKGTNSTMIGGIGNKDAALQALNQANEKIRTILAERMPQQSVKSVSHFRK
ncbi:MAG: hypothetical protein ACFWT7_09085 [Succiniclasticum sp.]|jgi:hypothetical protein